MTAELQLQRLYDRIELVPGVGDPRRGQLCIMSFVAFLAGEAHGDMPRTASSLIREFAVPVNDRVDSQTRQRLKPFAPRIVGTADGRDSERAELLYRAIVEEVVPDALEDQRRAFEGTPRGTLASQLAIAWEQLKSLAPAQLLAAIQQPEAHERRFVEVMRDALKGCMRNGKGRGATVAANRVPPTPAQLLAMLRQADKYDTCLTEALRDVVKARVAGKHGRMAAAAAHLLLACALNAPSAASRARYRNKAIELLDRMCEVGFDQRAARIKSDRVAMLESILSAKRHSFLRDDARRDDVLTCVR